MTTEHLLAIVIYTCWLSACAIGLPIQVRKDIELIPVESEEETSMGSE